VVLGDVLVRFLPPGLLLLAALLALATAPVLGRGVSEQATQESRQVVTINDLTPEARETVRSIRRGGPFPYERDGTTFGNFERALPVRERGYYREYTVHTPGSSHRGARRIVAGRGGELYYTDDHYRTFKHIRE
jgi:ribonuclease T1